MRDTSVGKCFRALHEETETLTIEDPVSRSREADALRTVLEREDF